MRFSLRFNNDLELLKSEVARQFPKQVDNFQRLLGQIVDYDDLRPETFSHSARTFMGEIITDPLLVEILRAETAADLVIRQQVWRQMPRAARFRDTADGNPAAALRTPGHSAQNFALSGRSLRPSVKKVLAHPQGIESNPPASRAARRVRKRCADTFR